MNKRQIVIEIICFLFIVLFVYAAVMKLMDVEQFRVQIKQSPLLVNFADLVVWAVPITEISIAMMLVIPRFRLIALFASLSLMSMFSAYILIILNFSEHIPCSCGGVLEKLGWTEHLIFNISFVALALVGLLLQPKNSFSSKSSNAKKHLAI